MRISDWSSDVCSSDLDPGFLRHCGDRRDVLHFEAQRTGGFEKDHTGLRRYHRADGFGIVGGIEVARGDAVARERAGKETPGRIIDGVAGENFVAGGEQREQRRSEEHTSELQSLMRNSYAVFGLTK